MLRDNVMLIKGCIPYNSKREKLAAWRAIKREFGNNVKILISDNLLTYSCKVDRTYYL